MKFKSDNQFLALSQKGKNDWWRYLTFAIVLIGLLFISFIIIEEVDPFAITQTSPIDATYETIIYMLLEGLAFFQILAGIYFAIRIIHKRDFSTLNCVDFFPVKEVLEGVLVWGTLVIIGSLINLQNPWRYFWDTKINLYLAYLIPVAIITIAIQSYTEEVIFRGYLLQSIALKIKNYYVLILLGSSIFGVLHVENGLEAVFGVALFGVLDCIIVLKRKSLAFVSGVHFINNFFYSFLLAGDEKEIAEKGFLDFDWVAIGIALVQFFLLFIYVMKKSKITSYNGKQELYS